MHRIVHLDLKGAPLKINYLEKVILSAKAWGATGFLIEWEDTFPYSAQIELIGSKKNASGDNLYSEVEVNLILQFIQDNGMIAIQLVQTFSHLEYVLKHPQFKHLREDVKSPAVICPSHPESFKLLCMMLEQALNIQPDAEYFHIGADEVWHMGICAECKQAIEQESKGHLLLKHIQKVALFIKEKRPNIKILAWDDMLRQQSGSLIKEFQLDQLIQPVIWNYNTEPNFSLVNEMWFKSFCIMFPNIWAASAFKGANGRNKIIPDVRRYVSTHTAWKKTIQSLKPNFKFKGIFLTGWSRYDHYATLCEMMPVSLPSLACCLKTMKEDDPRLYEYLATEEWPGIEVARGIHGFAEIKRKALELINGDEVATWLNPWQVERGFTNPPQITGIAITAKNLVADLMMVQTELTMSLRKVTGERSTHEFINTVVTPIFEKVNQLYEEADHRSKMEPGLLDISRFQERH